jgi:peptidoglycan/xylan/chitin deacetylase (PgdA/CDA1 family)
MLSTMASRGSAAKDALREPTAAALVRALRLSPVRAGLALCYHRVGDPQGRAGYELVPALGTRLFAAQLRHLAAAYRLVRASELPEAAATRRLGERVPLAITFDDDLAAHADAAAVLRAHGVTGTFFLGGATLHGPRTFWWQVLQRALDRRVAHDEPALPRVDEPDGRGGAHRLAAAVRSMPVEEREALAARLLDRLDGDVPEPGLRAPAARALAAAGFEIGFHTRDHEALATLEPPALDAALRDGRAELESACGAPLRAIAYPFGLADSAVADAARAAGFQTGWTLEPAPVRPDRDDPLLLGRFQPSFASAGHTATELARALLHRSQPSSTSADHAATEPVFAQPSRPGWDGSQSSISAGLTTPRALPRRRSRVA